MGEWAAWKWTAGICKRHLLFQITQANCQTLLLRLDRAWYSKFCYPINSHIYKFCKQCYSIWNAESLFHDFYQSVWPLYFHLINASDNISDYFKFFLLYLINFIFLSVFHSIAPAQPPLARVKLQETGINQARRGLMKLLRTNRQKIGWEKMKS